MRGGRKFKCGVAANFPASRFTVKKNKKEEKERKKRTLLHAKNAENNIHQSRNNTFGRIPRVAAP